MAGGEGEARSGPVGNFDDTYYLRHNVEARTRSRDLFHGSALLDYLWVGCRERCSPNECFDEQYYLEANPDVAAALQGAQFLCGYHHYLKNGRDEGRRAVAAAQGCVVDARRTSLPAGSVVALVSAIQDARPRWRVTGLAAWTPAGNLHRWAGWLEAPADAGRARELLAAERPAYLVCLDAPADAPPEGAVVVGAVVVGAVGGEGAGGAAGPRGLADVVVAIAPSALGDDAGLAIAAERVASALEAAEQVKRRARGSRLDGAGSVIGRGVTITLGAGDGERVVTVAVELPASAGASRERLVLETGGAEVALDPEVDRPAGTSIRVAATPSRIVIRPRKPGYHARSRVALARVEAAPVDLLPVQPVPAGAAGDALTLIDLNTDLARVKRELGRFMAKADALTAARPAFEFTVPAPPRLAPVVVPRCLLVSSFDAERSWVAADTLEAAAWREFLEARGFAVDLIELPPDTAGDIGRLRKQDLIDHRFVVLTGPRAPGLLTDGLEFGRHLGRLYRGAVSGGRAVDGRRRADDLACARAADRLILSGPADAACYRAAGIPAGRIDYVPAFLPSGLRTLSRPYAGRPRQLVVHVDTPALLDGRVAGAGLGKDALAAIAAAGWQVVISAAPRQRARIEAELGLGALRPAPGWCDPSTDLAQVLQSTRLVVVPGLALPDIGGLVAAAPIVGFRLLVNGPGRRQAGADHVVTVPGAAVPGILDALDRDPGSLDQQAVRAEAFRALDRVLGFRNAGWQEGRGDRAADI